MTQDTTDNPHSELPQENTDQTTPTENTSDENNITLDLNTELKKTLKRMLSFTNIKDRVNEYIKYLKRFYPNQEIIEETETNGTKVYIEGQENTAIYISQPPPTGSTRARPYWADDGVSHIMGHNGNNRLYGDKKDNYLFGDKGDDTIAGGGGSDWIDGGEGTDTITLSGSANEYQFQILADGAIKITDTVAGRNGIATVYNIECVSFSNTSHLQIEFASVKNNTLDFRQMEKKVFVYGDELNNTIQGSVYDDVLFGNNGDDAVSGNDGNDFIDGNAGNDILDGGNGNDTIYGGDGDDIVHGGDGNDILYGDADKDILDGGNGDDKINGGDGDDTVTGGEGFDFLYGNAGNDILDSGDGDDRVYGGDGDDIITGGRGNDNIDGGNSEHDVFRLSGNYADYFFQVNTDGSLTITDTTRNRDGTDTVRNIEYFSFKDVQNIEFKNLDISPHNTLRSPVPYKDILEQDKNGAPFTRTRSFTISSKQILANDTASKNKNLKIVALSDISGGRAELTKEGDILFTPDPNSTDLLTFKYTLEDGDGNAVRIQPPPYLDVIDDPNAQITPNTQTVRARVILKTPDLPKDNLFLEQWYLTDANVTPVWRYYTGKGIRLAQFEAGGKDQKNDVNINYEHADLKDKMEAGWQAPTFNYSHHATQVAGIMVAKCNDQGCIGVAYGATLNGFSSNSADLKKMRDYDAVNHSWGAELNFKTLPLNPGHNNIDPAYKEAITQGRKGLGTIIVKSAGNERDDGDNTNYYDRSNCRSTIVVGAINRPSDISVLEFSNTAFSTPGANILISAPSAGMLSPTLSNDPKASQYATVQGTSFGAPMITAISALMLEANPDLGYRDVQTILALTANKNIIEDKTANALIPWKTNGNKHWNGGGMHINYDYGYGKVDALAAVRLAENWLATPGTSAQTEANLKQLTKPVASNQLKRAIPNGDRNGIVETLAVDAPNMLIEHTEVYIHLTHQHPGDLIIKLIAPSGTESILMDRPGSTANNPRGSNLFHFTSEFKAIFSTARLRGESGQGEWKLQIIDAHKEEESDTGSLHSWSINLYGEQYDNNDRYIYTNEYAQLAIQAQADEQAASQLLKDKGIDITRYTQLAKEDAKAAHKMLVEHQVDINQYTQLIQKASRNKLKDTNGGIDTINVAAIQYASTINLETGQAILAGQTLTIETPDKIENLVGGHYDDHLTGNALNNTLIGGRGNDISTGGKGNDTYHFNRGDNADTIHEVDDTPGNQDTLSLGKNISAEQLWFSRKGNDLHIQIRDTSDSVTISKHYVSPSHQLERFQLSDGRTLLGSDAEKLVQAMSGFAPSTTGQITLSTDEQNTLNAVIAAYWK